MTAAPRPRQRSAAANQRASGELAIIIPTLNEFQSLARNLPAIVQLDCEVVISDGGSTDGTVSLARQSGLEVVEGSSGRGRQLNRGARATSAPRLVFLHADSCLPPEAVRRVHEALDGDAVGGGFWVRFAASGWVYRLGERVVNLRTSACKTPLGDQAHFVTREAFEDLNGYRDWPILEDLDFIRRLKRRGRLTTIPLPVTTSARRFESRGPLRTVLTNWLIWILYFLGVSPHRLADFYRDIR